MIKITFPDGSVREYAKGTTAYQVAESIPRLAPDTLTVSVNGELCDLNSPLKSDCTLKFHKWDDEEANTPSGTLPLT